MHHESLSAVLWSLLDAPVTAAGMTVLAVLLYRMLKVRPPHGKITDAFLDMWMFGESVWIISNATSGPRQNVALDAAELILAFWLRTRRKRRKDPAAKLAGEKTLARLAAMLDKLRERGTPVPVPN
jgi:hypothetical protein